jgi:hypothetical protein
VKRKKERKRKKLVRMWAKSARFLSLTPINSFAFKKKQLQFPFRGLIIKPYNFVACNRNAFIRTSQILFIFHYVTLSCFPDKMPLYTPTFPAFKQNDREWKIDFESILMWSHKLKVYRLIRSLKVRKLRKMSFVFDSFTPSIYFYCRVRELISLFCWVVKSMVEWQANWIIWGYLITLKLFRLSWADGWMG